MDISTKNSMIDSDMDSFDDDDTDYKNICNQFLTSITSAHCDELILNDYTIIDNFLGHDLSLLLLGELKQLTTTGLMVPNRTSFVNAKTGQPSIIAKPYIYEVDLHDEKVRMTMKTMNKIFIASKLSLIESLMLYLKDSMSLISGDKGRTVKLQWNQGNGACFPYHYDNPGPPNNRCLTCILYLNEVWMEGDGGEITLKPFLQKSVTIEPIFDRMVIFKSNSMLHRVEKSFKERFCMTFWIDGSNTNIPEKTELRLHKSSIEDIDNTIKKLRSPLQRSLSRYIYQEEYEESLYDCMNGAEGCEEMIASHHFHVKSIEKNILLKNLVDALRNWKVDN